MTEDYRLLAAVIAAHPNREVVGRTRLQKTMKLLQSLGLGTKFSYSIHFYGPYSEDLQAGLTLLEALGLAKEEQRQKQDGDGVYYVEKAGKAADPKLAEKFQKPIDLMAGTDQIVLELAATYQTFREEHNGHEEALDRLRHKKGNKCDHGNEKKALELLTKLGLKAA